MADQILTPAALIVAIAGGFGAGYLLVAPQIAGGTRSAFLYGFLIARMAAFFGGVFWLGQILANVVDGGQDWPRPVARALVWTAFSVAAGVGVWACLRRRDL